MFTDEEDGTNWTGGLNKQATDSSTVSPLKEPSTRWPPLRTDQPGKLNTRQPMRRWREHWKAWKSSPWHLTSAWCAPASLWVFMVKSRGQAGWVSSSLLHSAYIGSAIIMNYVNSAERYMSRYFTRFKLIIKWKFTRKLTIKYICVYILIHVCVKMTVLTF